MSRHARAGFTLVELMAVIAVIAILVATVVPYFKGVVDQQRNVACASKLEKIGQAYHARQATGATKGLRHSALSIATWQGDLLPFLSGSGDMLQCPADTRDLSGQTFASSVTEGLKEIYIEVFSGTAQNYSTHLWDVSLDENLASEWTWRLSQEQFDQLEATPGHGQNYSYTGYQPGGDPTTYWFVFEDQGWHGGGDKDYWDVFLKIHTTDKGVEVTPKKGAAGYNFSLATGKGTDKKTLIPDLKAGAGTAVEIPGIIATYSSYGVNSMVNRITEASGKLLVLDYAKPIARGSDYDDPDPWFSDESQFPLMEVGSRNIPMFFRHFNKANILLSNGSVHSMTFQEINIFSYAAREKYWNP